MIEALLLKGAATVLGIEKRSYGQCFVAVFLGICVAYGLAVSGVLGGGLLGFIVKLLVFTLSIVIVMDAKWVHALIIGAVFSFMVNVSITYHRPANTAVKSVQVVPGALMT
ncbi:hypothetical protein [Silvimonas amylolytica]|uniref:hypothetical protein n=1 Tax=Silvimonas amylolytica TaxID=449663 RepID=UPI00166CEC14|nr:hypothetical protein [Silvimonas amylolytica]